MVDRDLLKRQRKISQIREKYNLGASSSATKGGSGGVATIEHHSSPSPTPMRAFNKGDYFESQHDEFEQMKTERTQTRCFYQSHKEADGVDTPVQHRGSNNRLLMADLRNS